MTYQEPSVQADDFQEAVNRHYPGLVQRLALVLHDSEEAKDVAQEAYLRAYRSWDRFDGTDARAWLHTIGLRLAFNVLRGRRRWTAWLSAERREHVETWVSSERIDLWRALGSLRPQHRAALLLNVVDGYTQAEIAGMLDAPPGTVGRWIAEGKAHMRVALGEESAA